MSKKQQPLGICDNCLSAIHPDDPGWHTSKGQPRLYCGRDCRNAANSRAGAEIRGEKARQRVRRGEWQNPAKITPPTPEEQGRRARLGRQREVVAGTWRNPAMDDAAREKLSRPRKHGNNPILHAAIEKLRRGRVADLSSEEQRVYREHRRKLYADKKAAMTDADREAKRAWWREQWRKRKSG